MKSLQFLFIILLSFNSTMYLKAQESRNLETIAILHIDVKGFTMDPAQMGDITRIELSKLGQYQFMDKYDVDYLVDKNELTLENCYGKLCLVEIGKVLKVDKMLSGSVELHQDITVISLPLIDVATAQIDKTQVMEFLNIRNQTQTMIGITLQKMFDQPVDENILTKLTKKFDYKSSLNMPDTDRLSLNGPRMGVTFFSGTTADIMKLKEVNGGMDARPVMFQFGYQFEAKYINQGDFQALFEFVPIITGLDQGKFIPSISFLNGLRHNRFGWEFAFGPNLVLTQRAKGYYDGLGAWHLEEDWAKENPDMVNPFPIEKRLDSRGDYNIVSGFVFAVGKTFKSGRLNIPINAFFIPGRDDSHRFGVSMGYNVSSYK